VILALEVVEEGPLANVGGFCDVFDRDAWESSFSEELSDAVLPDRVELFL